MNRLMFFTVLTAVLLVLCSCTHDARRDYPSSVRVGGDRVSLPVEWCRNIPYVPMMVDGKGPFWMVLDTGASATLLRPEAVETLGLKPRRMSGELRGSSGKTTRVDGMVRLKKFSVGPMRFEDVDAIVKDVTELEWALGRPFDGILGMGNFYGTILQIDYPKETVEVSMPTHHGVPDEEWFANPGRRRPHAMARFGDVSFPVLIDSGSIGGVDLAVDLGNQVQFETEGLSASLGVATFHENRMGRLDGNVQIDGLVFEKPIVEVSGNSAKMGYEALKHLRVSFDCKGDRVALENELDAPIATPSLYTIGLYPKRFDDHWEVWFVRPGTPVELAGLKAGDRVEKWDGVAIEDWNCENVAGKVGQEEIVLSGVDLSGDPFELRITPVLEIE